MHWEFDCFCSPCPGVGKGSRYPSLEYRGCVFCLTTSFVETLPLASGGGRKGLGCDPRDGGGSITARFGKRYLKGTLPPSMPLTLPPEQMNVRESVGLGRGKDACLFASVNLDGREVGQTPVRLYDVR